MLTGKINLIYTLIFLTLLCTAIGASYYKYVVLRDFESIFYIPCEEGEENCFINTADCAEGADIAECSFVYKVIVINQSILDDTCKPDDGECLNEICLKSAEQCTTIRCTAPKASHYQLLDECSG